MRWAILRFVSTFYICQTLKILLMFGLEYWLSCSSIAPCQNFARMDYWTGCDKGFILGVRTKCACRPVRVRVLLVRYHIAKRKTLVLVVGVEGSLLFALVVALPFTCPPALVLTELVALGVGDVCFFLTMRCFNDAMFSNS